MGWAHYNRRRKRRDGPREPSKPFSERTDWHVISKGLNKLASRWLWYTAVAPLYKDLPDADGLRYHLYPVEVWEALDKAAEICAGSGRMYTQTWRAEKLTLQWCWRDYDDNRSLLPSAHWKPPGQLPDAVVNYINKVAEERQKWECVETILAAINKPGITRSAAAFTFPPVATFLKLGGHPDPELAEIKRAPNVAVIPPQLIHDLRAAISIAARACLMPEVPSDVLVKDDSALEVTISLPASKLQMLPHVIYPWKGGST